MIARQHDEDQAQKQGEEEQAKNSCLFHTDSVTVCGTLLTG
jgi:hypothetical protein